MGLDMYLHAQKYVSGWNKVMKANGVTPMDDEKTETLYDTLVAATGITPASMSPSFTIQATVAYWRKANMIHQWFVDNVQDGTDDCAEYDVSREQLEELLTICKQIKDKPEQGAELLPTQGGFFFGSTEYDEYYLSDIEDTIEQLEKVLNDPAFKADDNMLGAWYFQYRSSW